MHRVIDVDESAPEGSLTVGARGEVTLTGEIDWSGGNVVYVPLSTGTSMETAINAAISSATSGDTLVLAAGDWVIDGTITVNKKLHIKGMGKGITTIACATDLVAGAMLAFTTTAGSRVSDLTISYSATSISGSANLTDWQVNGNLNNVEFIDTSTGTTHTPKAINLSTASVTVNAEDCSYAGSGANGGHWLANVTGVTTELNIRRCNATSAGGTGTLGNVLVYGVGAASRVVNIYDSHFSSAPDIAKGVIYNGGTTTIYNSTINGSGATAYDVENIANTLTLHAGTELVNNKTSGTITYAGTAVTSDLYVDDDAQVNGDVNGTLYSTAKQHDEIGVLLDILTAPVAIVGFTGTGATTSTENGYESGAGRVWTYSGGLTTDKIFQGQTYVYSFDGVDSYLSTPDTDDMSFGDGANDSAFSVGGWVEVTSTASRRSIIGKWDQTTGSEAREWYCQVDENHRLNMFLYDESAAKLAYCIANAGTELSGWHHVVVTYDGGGGATAANGITMYVDGVAVACTPTNDASYVAMENLATLPMIGARTGASALERFWDGAMGRIFVEPTELTAAQVWEAYQRTRGFYSK